MHPREFGIGNLVLRKVLSNTKVKTHGKLGPNLKGPYRVTKIAGVGAYRLAYLQGNLVSRPWNIQNMRNFFALSSGIT